MSFYKNYGLSKPLREPNPNTDHNQAPSNAQELEKWKSMYANLQADFNRLQEENKSGSYEELKETRTKLKVITNKFSTVRKERDGIKKENSELRDEILELQANMRQMVPGFQNTSSSFPMWNEIGHMTEQFYKCDCQDLFFDTLSPDLSMDGVIYYFRFAFSEIREVLNRYFSPLEGQLKDVACVNDINGPIMNVLRKSF
jgi:archaellum component FlaC